MRILYVMLPLCLLSGCASDKYSSVPEPKGKWEPANINPDSDDNNILPTWAQDDAVVS